MTGLTFDDWTHSYFIDGRRVPQSVTGVLKRAGLIDFTGVPDPILERARVRGSTVHQAIHYWNEGDLYDADGFRASCPDYAPYFDAWVSFVHQRRFVSVLCEHRVYSRRHDVAGTVDCFGLLDGSAVLLDFATGDPNDVSKDLQTAAYALLAREWSSEDGALDAFFGAHPVVRRYGVRLMSDASFRLEPYTDPSDVRHFLALLDAQRIVDARRESRRLVAV